MAEILNVAAYKFVPLDDLATLQAKLRDAAAGLGLRGTILLAAEGINLFLAGEQQAVDRFLTAVEADPRVGPLEVKRSYSATQPFGKLLVKLKQEIIPLGRPDIDPARSPAPRVSAQQLKGWLDRGHDDAGRALVLLDTRNAFEVDRGSFDGAIDIRLDNFRSFADRVRELDPQLREATVVTFCTGGIRCEKAAPLLLSEGFPSVVQLDGGILKYFEECGRAHYHGDCFVFDERVALDENLAAQAGKAGGV